MFIGGSLELIQSFNNLRSLMLLTAVCRRVSFTVGGSFSLSSEISSNSLNCSLKWRTNCSVVLLKLSSRTVLVTYWVSLLFSETLLEDVLMCSLSSFHTFCTCENYVDRNGKLLEDQEGDGNAGNLPKLIISVKIRL